MFAIHCFLLMLAYCAQRFAAQAPGRKERCGSAARVSCALRRHCAAHAPRAQTLPWSRGHGCVAKKAAASSRSAANLGGEVGKMVGCIQDLEASARH